MADSTKGTLIMKRRIGERIVIANGSIVITVLGGGKISVECPKVISVHRGEVFDKIKETANAQA